jgi:hypothetical protein
MTGPPMRQKSSMLLLPPVTTPAMQKLPLRLMINFMTAANMIAQLHLMMKQKWIAARMENAARKVTMAKIVVKKKRGRWIAAKTENAVCPAITVKIAAKQAINHYKIWKNEEVVSFSGDRGNRVFIAGTVYKSIIAGYRSYLRYVQQCYQ